MKQDKGTIWLKRGILWGLVFLLAYGLVALEARQKGEKGTVRATTYSASDGGYKALYLWLRDLGVPVKRWTTSLRYLPPEASSLMIADPEVGPERGELKALDLWVKNGGTLILVIRPPNVFLENFGLRTEGMGSQGKSGSLYQQPGPYTEGVQTIRSKWYAGFIRNDPEWVFHLRDKIGGLLAVKGQGEGRVIALSDPVLFSNGSLREGDHAVLCLNLFLNHSGKGFLLVDEYHHGYGRTTSVLNHFGTSRAFAPFLQGVLLVMILWAGMGRRLDLPGLPKMKRREHRWLISRP